MKFDIRAKLQFALSFLLLYATFNASGQIQDLTANQIPINTTSKTPAMFFEDFEILQLDVSVHLESLQNDQEIALEIPFDEKNYLLDLNPNELIQPDYTLRTTSADKAIESSNRAIPTQGWTQEGQRASIAIASDFVYGTWKSGAGEKIYIEPLRFYDAFAERDQFVVFYSKDITDTTSGACGVRQEHHLENKIKNSQMESISNGDCKEVEMAIATDYLMFQKYGSVQDVENRNIGVINDVQNNYEGEFDDDLLLEIVEQFIVDCSGCDPWTSSTDAGTLLSSFTNWGPGGFSETHDVGELWTDRNFNGSTLGIAWVGSVCTSNRYHVCQDFSSNSELIRVLAAHEMGHNFSLTHDASGAPFIMAPAVNPSNNWSNQSQNQMNNFVPGLSCLASCTIGPTADFGWVTSDLCEETEAYFYDLSDGDVASYNWSFPGGVPSSSSDQNPIVTYNSPGTYEVSLTVTAANGETDTETKTGIITVGGNGSTVKLYQDFEDGLGDWIFDNSSGSGWSLTGVEGAEYGEEGVWVNNFNGSPGSNENLLSPVFSLAGHNEATLHMDYAYCRKNGVSDSLIISVSTDGGQTFSQVEGFFETGNGSYATAANRSSSFNPTSSDDWCLSGIGNDCLSIPLPSSVAQEEEVQIRIRNKTLGGNNLFVDRLWVTTDCYELLPPVADFTSNVQSGCATLVVDYEDLSTGVVEDWNWFFEGGNPETSTDQNPTVFYAESGVYDVELIALNAAGQSIEYKSAYVIVDGVPDPEFDADVVDRDVAFINMTQNGSSYEWDFGDGNSSTEENPVHNYNSDGTYEVVLEAFNNCGSSEYTLEITIDTEPVASFTVTDSSGCAPFEVTYDAASSENAEEFDWSFPGGTPSSSQEEEVTVTYDSAGVYDVQLIVSNDFGADTLDWTDFIEITGSPSADFSFEVQQSEVEFTNESTNYDSVRWSFGDGSESSEVDPNYDYGTVDTFEVQLVAYSDQCGNDTAIQTVITEEGLQANFEASTDEGCVPLTVDFEGLPADADSFQWEFSGGAPAASQSQNPSVEYSEAGAYDVQVIVFMDGEVDTLIANDAISVNEGPTADFVYESDMLEVTFTNQSENFDSLQWTFGDGSQSQEENPVHTYGEDGVYDVSLTVWNECDTSTIQTTITVSTPPTAVIANAGNMTGCSPLVVTYIDSSSANTVDRMWIFEGGSPASSMEEEVEVTYETAGTYDVSLIVFSLGHADTLTLEDAVEVLPDPEVDFTFSVDSLTVEFSNQSVNADGYLWEFGDGNESTATDPTHIYDEAGSFDVTLHAYNECDTVSLTRTIGTGGLPNALFSAEGAREGCAPFSVQFTDESDGLVDSWDWTFEGGTPGSSSEQNPTVVYEEPGLYDVMLVVTNSNGSNQLTRHQYIRVHPEPNADLNFEMLNEREVAFGAEIDTSFNWDIQWIFGDGNESDSLNPVHRFEEEGNYEVLFIVSNFCGADTTSQIIEIETTSIEPSFAKEIEIFPNPARHQVQVRNLPTGADLFVKNAQGQIVLQRQNVNAHEQLEPSHLPSGMYFLEVVHGGERAAYKLVIQR